MSYSILVRFISVVLLLLLLSCSRDKSSSFYAEGEEQLAAGQLSAALSSFRRAYLEGDQPSAAQYQLGLLLANQKDAGALAAWHLQQFLLLNPRDTEQTEKARQQLQQLERQEWRRLNGKYAELNQSENKLKIQLLEEQLQQLKKWLSRLDRENYSLRQMLLDEKKSSPIADNKQAISRMTTEIEKPKTVDETQSPELSDNKKLPDPQAADTPAAEKTKEPEKFTRHLVSKGETLGKIAKLYFGSASPENIQKISLANAELLPDPDYLRIGMQLKIPLPSKE